MNSSNGSKRHYTSNMGKKSTHREPQNISDEDLARYWTPCGLSRWSPTSLAKLAIPEMSKQFLISIGLPKEISYWNLKFHDRVPTQQRPDCGRTIYQIGAGYGYTIGIDGSGSGAVVAISDDERLESFINASVRQLAVFLLLNQRAVDVVKKLSTKKWLAFAAQTEGLMLKVDSTALSNPDNFWPFVLRDMRMV